MTAANLECKTAKKTEKKFYIFLTSTILLFLFLLPPAPDGLSEGGRRSLLLVLYAITLWATEAVHPALTALLLMVLFSLLGVISFSQAVAGLGDTSVWLLLGVFIISAAMQESGFDRRVALSLLRLARGNTRLTILMVIVSTTFFIFLLPTSSGRAALMTPICVGMARAMQLKQGSNIGKTMLISVSFVSLVGSMGLMTGALSMVYAVGLFESLINHKWTYLSWLQALLPGAVISGFFMWPLLLKLFPPEVSHVPGGVQYINDELKKLGKLSGKEIKIILLAGLMIGLWIFEEKVNLSVSQSCLLISLATMLPGIDIITWKKAASTIDWGVVMLLGASLSMVQGLTSTQAIAWLASNLFSGLTGMNPTFLAITLLLALTIIRLGFPNLLSMVATTLPVVFTMAFSAGINPVWLGLISICGTVLGLFLPTQSITHLTTYTAGLYTVKDMLRAGFFTTLLVMSVTLFLAHFYWPLIGIPPIIPYK